MTLMLSTMKSMAEIYGWSATESIGKGLMLYFDVEDVDAFHKRVMDGGVEVVKELEGKLYGRREFVVRDINGYMLTFGGHLDKEK